MRRSSASRGAEAVNTYAKLPGLLRRIDALESGVQLCRQRDCYGRPGLFAEGAFCGFCSTRFAFGLRLSMSFALRPTSLNPFIQISSAC